MFIILDRWMVPWIEVGFESTCCSSD